MNKENVILFILLFTYTFAGWAPQISGTNASLNDVYFPYDTLTGYICGDSGIILKTTNSGIDWIRQNTPVTTKLNAIYFIGDTGLCVGNGAGLMTTDGGLNWEGDSNGSINFYDVLLFNGGAILFIGNRGIALRTFDFGRTWQDVSIRTTATLRNMSFINNFVGWVVGDSGSCWKTTDFGNSWQSKTVPTTAALRGVYFVDNNVGYVVGDSGYAFKTTDGGDSWAILALPTTQNLCGIDFEDGNTGYICGGEGFVSKFLHGQWTIINPWIDLFSINFPAPMVGWTVGSNGSIYKTSDGMAVTERINKKEISTISCSPNPFTNYLIVKTSFKEKKILTIYDKAGKLISEERMANCLFRLNGRALSKGVYFIKINRIITKVVKI